MEMRAPVRMPAVFCCNVFIENLLREQSLLFRWTFLIWNKINLLSLTASLPGYPVSITVGNAIKNRATNEEILTALKEVPNPNQEDNDGVFHYLFYFIFTPYGGGKRLLFMLKLHSSFSLAASLNNMTNGAFLLVKVQNRKDGDGTLST